MKNWAFRMISKLLLIEEFKEFDQRLKYELL